MSGRRAVLLLLAAAPLALSGCGWRPLYADPQSGPTDAALRAIRVAPIAERIGQRLELRLRDALNPTGIPAPQRYVLRTTLAIFRSDLGIQSQGLATRGKLDVYATFFLVDLPTGHVLLTNTAHSADGFDISANEYATIVAEDDARTRIVGELAQDIMTRLSLFLQRRTAAVLPRS
ncbi:MAG TPA: LPS assembly lipoprotein LptE [Stellaceae bacterium]|nr:LPS assembly lipoprotein LptE [Stellaceae bacterium]